MKFFKNFIQIFLLIERTLGNARLKKSLSSYEISNSTFGGRSENFPTWLQEMIKEFKTIFTNQLSKHSIMDVEPATFTLKKNVKIPNNNLTAHLPPANLRESADKLLDKLEQGGLIKKAPRVCKYKSNAFFKAKKNNDARLLVNYKASQVNNLLERPTHPQFSVEQLT